MATLVVMVEPHEEYVSSQHPNAKDYEVFFRGKKVAATGIILLKKDTIERSDKNDE